MKRFNDLYKKIIENVSDGESDGMSIEEYCEEFGGERTLDDLHEFIRGNSPRLGEYVQSAGDEELGGSRFIVARYKDGGAFVIDEDLNHEPVKSWIENLSDSELEAYSGFEYDFWSSHDFGNLYHATTEDNVESIQRDGLGIRDKTRGISNRGVGAAIFTSLEPNEYNSYGEFIFEIDVARMAEDGYKPMVEMEPDFVDKARREAILHKLGIRNVEVGMDAGSDGTAEDTRIVHGRIPAKYLKLMED
jgi:hypothetical protein